MWHQDPCYYLLGYTVCQAMSVLFIRDTSFTLSFQFVLSSRDLFHCLESPYLGKLPKYLHEKIIFYASNYSLFLWIIFISLLVLNVLYDILIKGPFFSCSLFFNTRLLNIILYLYTSLYPMEIYLPKSLFRKVGDISLKTWVVIIKFLVISSNDGFAILWFEESGNKHNICM